MDVLQFPKREGVKDSYWKAYYESVRKKAVLAGIQVMVDKGPRVWCGGSLNAYSCTLNDKQFIMDFSDLKPFQVNPIQHKCTYFKWQYTNGWADHMGRSNVYPLCPVQDYDWGTFVEMREMVKYDASGSYITNNQRERAAARQRRANVHALLRRTYDDFASTEFIEQQAWWMFHNTALVAVHVPGARNDMLDRGQLELMGLGVCVISPEITTMLGRQQRLMPGVDYIQCAKDYSDLIAQIEWVRRNPKEATLCGTNARTLFDSIVPPQQYWRYIKGVLNG